MLVRLSGQFLFLETYNGKMQMGKVVFVFTNSVLLQRSWHCPDSQISGIPQNPGSLQVLEHFSQHSQYEIAGSAGR